MWSTKLCLANGETITAGTRVPCPHLSILGGGTWSQKPPFSSQPVGPDQTDTVYIRKDEIIAILEVSSAAPDQARSNAMIILGREAQRQFSVVEKAAAIYDML